MHEQPQLTSAKPCYTMSWIVESSWPAIEQMERMDDAATLVRPLIEEWLRRKNVIGKVATCRDESTGLLQIDAYLIYRLRPASIELLRLRWIEPAAARALVYDLLSRIGGNNSRCQLSALVPLDDMLTCKMLASLGGRSTAQGDDVLFEWSSTSGKDAQ